MQKLPRLFDSLILVSIGITAALILATQSGAENQLPCQFSGANPSGKWHTANLSKRDFSCEFNDYWGMVGSTQIQIPFFRKEPFFKTDSSTYFKLSKGPYEHSLLEVQYGTDHRHIQRFRFVEQAGQRMNEGPYSDWQDHLPVDDDGLSNFGDVRHDPLSLFYATQNFTRVSWQFRKLPGHDISVHGDRSRQVWDLLHCYLIIGMTRAEIKDLLGASDIPGSGVDTYFLEEPGDYWPHGKMPSIRALDLSYQGERVTAFRVIDAETATHQESYSDFGAL
ncbi:MAG TPA: hypothetical protein V6C81_04330 [Planktothrix sp.]|jgi:hypothetical protein